VCFLEVSKYTFAFLFFQSYEVSIRLEKTGFLIIYAELLIRFAFEKKLNINTLV